MVQTKRLKCFITLCQTEWSIRIIMLVCGCVQYCFLSCHGCHSSEEIWNFYNCLCNVRMVMLVSEKSGLAVLNPSSLVCLCWQWNVLMNLPCDGNVWQIRKVKVCYNKRDTQIRAGQRHSVNSCRTDPSWSSIGVQDWRYSALSDLSQKVNGKLSRVLACCFMEIQRPFLLARQRICCL